MNGDRVMNRPTHIAYVVSEPESLSQKAKWHEVGACWLHEDGRGFTVVLHPQISVSGRIVCTVRRDRDQSGGESGK